MEKQTIKVTIFGKNYVVSASEQSEQIVRAAQLVDEMMNDAAQKAPNLQEAKAAVLVSLQLATDLIKAQHDASGTSQKLDEIVAMLGEQSTQ